MTKNQDTKMSLYKLVFLDSDDTQDDADVSYYASDYEVGSFLEVSSVSNHSSDGRVSPEIVSTWARTKETPRVQLDTTDQVGELIQGSSTGLVRLEGYNDTETAPMTARDTTQSESNEVLDLSLTGAGYRETFGLADADLSYTETSYVPAVTYSTVGLTDDPYSVPEFAVNIPQRVLQPDTDSADSCFDDPELLMDDALDLQSE